MLCSYPKNADANAKWALFINDPFLHVVAYRQEDTPGPRPHHTFTPRTNYKEPRVKKDVFYPKSRHLWRKFLRLALYHLGQLTSRQASGNFGTPITAALRHSGYDVTIISRDQSTTTFPPGAPVIKAATYSAEVLTPILTGQDAVVSVNGPAGMGSEVAIIDAAEAAGVKRFIINDFGWGPNVHGLPEFDEIHARRRGGWDHAKTLAMANPKFTWTGITIGNPIDWVNFLISSVIIQWFCEN